MRWPVQWYPFQRTDPIIMVDPNRTDWLDGKADNALVTENSVFLITENGDVLMV